MRLLILLVAFALAGCLDAPVDDLEVPAEVDVPEELLQFTESFNLVINPNTPGITIGGTKTNCVFIDNIDSIVNGTVTLAWDDMGTTPTMGIDVWGVEEDAYTGTGSSPVILEFGTLTGEDAVFVAYYTPLEGSMPVAQSATMSFDLVYEGEEPTGGVGTCGWFI